ncbi:MAG TPA: amino acid adenylation domain-containing protein [Terriglobales bacterium]|nr:amino acid adenylation domain-containing protein [Terriglobales bacterium]
MLNKQLSYWRERLSNPPETLELPLDRPRPVVATSKGASVLVSLPRDLCDALKNLGHQAGTTLFMILLAGFQTLLARYTGQDDIILGSPIANRNRSEIENLIGFFVNTLLLRTDLSGDPTFRELLNRVREVALGAYAHQDLPFEKLVEELQPRRSLSHNPLFQVLFSLRNVPVQSFELSGLKLDLLAAENTTAKMDLSLWLSETKNGLVGRWEYNTDLFDRQTIERMAAHYETLLHGIVHNLDQKLSEIPLLPKSERQQVLFAWNNTKRERHWERSNLVGWFEEQVRLTPTKVAFLCGGDSITYEALNARANRIAHFLLAQNLSGPVTAAVCMERSIETVAALLAVFKAGCTYLPLDPAYPRERLAYMLQDSGAQVVLTNDRQQSVLPQSQAHILNLDGTRRQIENQPNENPGLRSAASDPAYMIYTSGSTGVPKGVVASHRQIINRFEWMWREYPFSPDDVSCQKTALSFVDSLWELLGPLLRGSPTAIIPDEVLRDPYLLVRELADKQVTRIWLVPALMASLLDAFPDGLASHLPELNFWVASGEPLPALLLERFEQAMPHATLFNLYGTSEVWDATWYDPSHHGPLQRVPIGKPIDNVRAYILDKYRQPVPIGVAGEVYIACDGLADGYLHHADWTAEKWIRLTFLSDGTVAYRTGDRCRFLGDGNIEYLGRFDDQVKLNGFRIELEEVERALAHCAGVQKCVVILRQDRNGNKRLVGYVVPSEGEAPTPAQLRTALKAKLPDYMVPSMFVMLTAFPLTPSGKISRRSLPEPETERRNESETVAPRTTTEEALVKIWERTLDVRPIGINDDFFELGGHSLLGTQVISRIRQTLHVELPLRALFEASTIAALAERVDRLHSQSRGLPTPSIERVDRNRPLPLSFAQQRLWFLEQLEPDNPLYNVPRVVRLSGKLDVAALERALNEVIRRHEALRTSFRATDGEPILAIAPELKLPLQAVDLTSWPESQREAEARQRVAEEIRRPFRLSTGPLVRAALLKLADTEHVLVLNTHHVISDRWSLGVLSQELTALYEAFAEGRPSPLPELAVQYADYAVWQRKFLSGDVLESQLRYWKNHLAGAPASIDLPTDRQRPPVQTFHGALSSITLPLGLVDQLKALRRKDGLTLFMTMMAAFNVLLSRYSGQTDLVVGSPIAGRHRGEVEKLIGFFVNTLVLRTDLSGNPTFEELLGRVRENAMAAYAHQDLPFEKLVEELKPERDLSRNPLFQVMLILQNVPASRQSMGELTVSSFLATGTTSKFDLTLMLSEQTDGLRATFEYNTDLFDETSIVRMLGHFRTLLEGIVADPRQRIAELPLLSAEERRQILVGWNTTDAGHPQCCLPALFSAQAQKTPQRIAVEFGSEQITYEELETRSNQLAHYLRAQGVQSEVLVGLCLERSIDMVVALLAILKAGGAYVPLDPSYPKDRIALIVEDATPGVLVTQSSLLGALPTQLSRTACLDLDQAAISQQSKEPLLDSPGPRNLAYVLYTSGSTGKPKGVQIEHRGLVNFLCSMLKEPGLQPDDRVLAVTTLSFDIAGLEIYLPLICGARIVLATREQASDGSQLADLLNASKVTLMQATPATWRMLIESGWTGCSGLRVLCGGEALTPDLANHLLTRCAQLWNVYGPTETTVWSTVYWVKSPLASVAPVGRPVANTALYILDAQRQPVPIGAAGELYIGGEGVARGYLNRPELTSERFIGNPFVDSDDARLYKTGDLARYSSDGDVHYLGRTDFQVKVRGFRIELGEIEAVLGQHSSVQQNAVVVREDVPGDRRLVAYVVPVAGQSASTNDLRSFLKASLPEYMVPGAFVILDSLPLTPNGKVDRKALPAPEPVAAENFVAPQTEIEQAIAEIWEAVLHTSPIGVHANFFELGGHSLLATQVVSRIQKQFGAHLPLRSFFEHPTIFQLAKELGMPNPSDGRVLESTIPKLPRDGTVAIQSFPLSFGQQRLWVLDRLEPNSPAYNVPITLRLRGTLNVSALEYAINQVLRRHEILRAEIHSENGEPVQKVLPAKDLSLPVVDLSGKPLEESEERALRLAAEEARKPFHLAHGPLLRSKLLRLSDRDFILMITVHHIVFDGWSTGTLLHEIAAHYESALSRKPSGLPELPIQYTDYAAWQRDTLQGDVLEQELAYWKRELDGAPASIELPTDRPRPPMQSFRGRTRVEFFELPLMRRLQEISRQRGVTPFMTLLAAFSILLQRYSGQDDLVVGTPIAGRNHPEIERLIGLFVNTLLLRTNLSGNPTFLELLERVRKTAMGAYAHQEVPFERLVEELKPERDLSRNPLFQVLFVLQNLPRDEWKMTGVTPIPFQAKGETEKFDLSVTLVEKANGLKATFGYNTDLFDEATIVRMVGHFRRLLEAIAVDPEQYIADLPLLTDAEEQKLLVDFNHTAADYPRDSSVYGLFEAQADRTPDAIAVIFQGEQITYRELNQRANQIAHYLRKSGVGPDILVGIYVERALNMVAGILGILKAGGAYVPLDPAYPKDRIAFILENAQAPVLLTQQSLLETLPPLGAKAIQLDADWPAISQESIENPAPTSSPKNLAYVLYTSGSTGKPKGVQIEHRNLVNFLTTMNKEPGLTASDVLLAVTTLSFDIAGLELYLPLINGATVLLTSREQAADGKELIALLENSGVTVLQATPATWRMLIESGWKGHSNLKALCGGEALPPDLADQLLSRCGELWNMYGPTETTIWSSVYRVVSTLANTAPIGRPIANTTMYVLDARKQPVPIGVPGELYIGGDGVARGYWKRPELTAEKFLADPFREGERMYRTGDLAKFMSDGNIQFLGRADFQVKVRGFRIELEEIEAVLAQHPSVQQGVVIVREDRPGDKRLVGYLIPKPNLDPSTVELREHLKGSLPEYMVPQVFVKLPSLPLTPNGKINRRALPSPDWSQLESLGSVPARDQLELMLVRIWQKVLGLPQVGITDNFFDLGGHSLLAARLLAEVEKVTGRQIPLSALFRGATVESLAQILREGSEANPDPVVMEIQAGNGSLPFFAIASPGVDTLGYALLARHMGSDQPLYKLQAHEPVVERRPFTEDELRQLSQEYIAAMRAVQPQGPYCIGGMCEGVQIAERMVLELEAQGQQVGLFAIFDTWVLQHSQDPWRWRLYYYQQRLRSLRKISLGDQLKAYKRVARNKIGQVTGKVQPRTDWQQAYWPENFKPRKFRAPIALFKRPKQPFYYVDDPQMGWGQRTETGVEIHEIDFHHLEILREPYVRMLGERLAACISRIQSNGDSPEHAGGEEQDDTIERTQ